MREKYFPLFISMEQKKILLVGAGGIALRRAGGLLDFGAVLTVVAPKIRDEFHILQQQYGEDNLILVQREFVPGEIEGYDFVLSATDSREADFGVYRECRDKKVPVNIASDQSLCDFQFPALIEYDQVVIGVNSGGRDHKKVRNVSAGIREFLHVGRREEEPRFPD